MLNPATAFLNTIHPLSPGLLEYIELHIKSRNIPKKSILLKAGQTAENIYFIEKGILRSFNKKKDKEICNWFMGEGDLIIAVNSFYQQVPSEEFIESLEPCVLHSLSFKQLQHIYFNFPEFNFIGRQLTEHYYLLSEKRNVSMRFNNASERYAFLKKTSPSFFHRVPAKYIASYLGISAETMSRIKKK
ncbi:MAG: Crp/Fnr family transcriptional regulator [Sphingobacteriia bacterium]|nr:MAG: Crp/Fnr family transcriptional regulator [Sphingobacteriia bacterium]TAG30152.1 MAG: Crp/Fnr family transcriptional regulator [Sphingobacteriia bacterium]TAH06599.1 MAG: Crp/Fnr family transcriptional regulator [Sphingobacteriia bacterium]